MQIREATCIEGKLYDPPFFKPVIDTFLRAIPHAYDQLDRDDFLITVEIKGSCGGRYTLQKKEHSTAFCEDTDSDNKVIISQEEFWKLVTNSKPKNEVAFEGIGDNEITEHFLKVVAVMS